MRLNTVLAIGYSLAVFLGCGQQPQQVRGRKPQPSPTEPKTSAVGSGPVIEVGDADFDRQVLQSDKPVLVDFWAPWCGPCQRQGPIIEKVGARYADRLRTFKVNVDEAKQTANRYQIRSIPTLLVFKAGQIVLSRVGLTDEETLTREIEKLL